MRFFKEVIMDLTKLSTVLLNSGAIPEDIKNNPLRLSDFMLGAEKMYQLLSTTFGDDLK